MYFVGLCAQSEREYINRMCNRTNERGIPHPYFCCCQFVQCFVYCCFYFVFSLSLSLVLALLLHFIRFVEFEFTAYPYILYVSIIILRVFIDWNECLWCYFSNRFRRCCCCFTVVNVFFLCMPMLLPFLRNFSYMAFFALQPNMWIFCMMWFGSVHEFVPYKVMVCVNGQVDTILNIRLERATENE